MSELEQSVRDLLGRRSLRGDQLSTLQALQGDSAPERGRRPRQLKAVSKAALAAVAVFAALAPLLAWLSYPVAPDADLPRLVANELAANHLKLKPMEVRGDRIADIRGYFTELDFVPRQTRRQDLVDLELLGGRYCSVLGVTAAQLRLRKDDAAPLKTLYQAPYDPQRFGSLPSLYLGERPMNLGARGLDVQLWVEKGILFAVISE